MHEAFNSAEWNLVLGSCSRLAKREGEANFLNTPAGSFDESILQHIVERHRIAPLVYVGIKDLTCVSDDLKASLRSRVLTNQMEVLAVKQFMIGFHDFITPLGYDHLFLKGLVVAEQYYDDPGLRSAVDVDVWVEPAGIDAVSQWLMAMGYRTDWDLQGLNPKQIQHLRRVGHEICFIATKPNLPTLIELHTRIDSPYSKFVYHPTQEKKTFSYLNIGGRNFPVMNHEDQFLYLCVHGTAHAWFRLKWLCDLPQLMHRVTLDWERVRGRSIQLNCLEQLEFSWLVLHNILGEKIPAPILSTLNPQKYRAALRHVYACIAAEKGVNESDANRIKHLLYNLRWVRGLPRFSFFQHYLTGPGDWKIVQLPENLFFLYYLLRPFLWLYKRIAVLSIFMQIQPTQ